MNNNNNNTGKNIDFITKTNVERGTNGKSLFGWRKTRYLRRYLSARGLREERTTREFTINPDGVRMLTLFLAAPENLNNEIRNRAEMEVQAPPEPRTPVSNRNQEGNGVKQTSKKIEFFFYLPKTVSTPAASPNEQPGKFNSTVSELTPNNAIPPEVSLPPRKPRAYFNRTERERTRIEEEARTKKRLLAEVQPTEEEGGLQSNERAGETSQRERYSPSKEKEGE
jgi:hypothetical protein